MHSCSHFFLNLLISVSGVHINCVTPPPPPHSSGWVMTSLEPFFHVKSFFRITLARNSLVSVMTSSPAISFVCSSLIGYHLWLTLLVPIRSAKSVNCIPAVSPKLLAHLICHSVGNGFKLTSRHFQMYYRSYWFTGLVSFVMTYWAVLNERYKWLNPTSIYSFQSISYK